MGATITAPRSASACWMSGLPPMTRRRTPSPPTRRGAPRYTP